MARSNSSYKKITLLLCFFNIALLLYALRTLYASLYIYSGNVSRNSVLYNPDQIRKMEESIRIRKEFKPEELIKLVKDLEGEFSTETAAVELPPPLKQSIIDEILQRLTNLNSTRTDIAKEREAVENWRMEKLREAKLALVSRTSNSAIPHEEAGMLARALESDWAAICEEIGLWIPVQVVNTEHEDKPEGAEGFGIIHISKEEVLPGRSLPPECHAELHTDYDGDAVRWGLTHHKASAADCCQACLDHAKHAKEGQKKCNIWVYCPSEFGCHSPDRYQHKHQECWLKYAEKPRLNFKDKYPEWYRNSHQSAPVVVPWVSGIVSV
ncbi:hypothetical protein Ahy_A08g037890 isoform A [Arachis hypogaea]|uniref:Apple domain-containing protein n=2 Tax=Arachis hypogaea TaxID=3818 RepID=A0A445BSA1_ARAHY|nr:hypothetical protein Ahy_A08g037890 isoform A [Arachis hypogaea]